MKRNFLKGFTLIEVLIASFVALLVIGVASGTSILAKKYWQAEEGAVEVAQNAQIALESLTQDLKDSNIDTLTDASKGPHQAISFLSAYNQSNKFVTDSQGKPIWQKYVIYYIYSGSNKMLRKYVYGNFTKALTPEQLNSYCDGEGRVIAFDIKNIDIYLELPLNQVKVTVETKNTNLHGKVDSLIMESTIFFNN